MAKAFVSKINVNYHTVFDRVKRNVPEHKWFLPSGKLRGSK